MNLLQKIRLLFWIDELTKEVNNVKNWKTTLFGALTAAGLGMSQASDATVSLIGKILSVVASALMGLFAKDNNVTGGTKPQ